MNLKIKTIIYNFSYTVTANMISALISAALVFIVPKVLDLTQYGFWQLSVFYSTYVGYMHLGWADGTYLRYGGEEYSELEKKKFKSQFWLLTCMEVLIAAAIIGSCMLFVEDIDRKLILITFGISCVLQIPGTWLRLVLQATNQIRNFANNLLIEKGFYGLGIIFCMMCGVKSYRPLLLVDIISKIISIVTLAYVCRDIVFCKGFISLKKNFREAWENLSAGSKLLVANLTSMLIIGVVRIAIERVWSIDTFGKVSLVLNISNIFMVLINACSVIMYPLLKKMNSDRWASNYDTIRTALMFFLAGALLGYYPLKMILDAWLPQYRDSLVFLSILFPICLYEGKTAMLINTYMKALRMEKQMLLVNLISVLISSFISLLIFFFIHNLVLAVLTIVFVLSMRCIFAELVLTNKLGIKVSKNIKLELFLTVVFIGANWFMSFWASFLLYSTIYILYLFLQKQEVHKTISIILNKINGRKSEL